MIHNKHPAQMPEELQLSMLKVVGSSPASATDITMAE